MNKRGARAIAILAGSTGGTVGGFVAGTIVSALAGAGGMSIVIVIAATLGGALGHGISVAVAFGIEFLVRPVRPGVTGHGSIHRCSIRPGYRLRNGISVGGAGGSIGPQRPRLRH